MSNLRATFENKDQALISLQINQALLRFSQKPVKPLTHLPNKIDA